MERQKFEAYNGTYVELTPRAAESLRDAGFETLQEQVDFSRAMAGAAARAERLHVMQVSAERSMAAAIEANDLSKMADGSDLSRAQ
ncbi:hypothetical protein ACWDHH_15730 [Janibacter hoylei]|uniref:hypothetical protein n=1 Tax=unclassified Janibacter TaxID=2649294 RepID=UPI003F8E36F6